MAQSVRPGQGLRKRNQIQAAGKMMFVWVAAASLIVGVSGVGVYLLAQKIHFGNQVISEKSNTKKILEGNLEQADDLLASVQVLNTSQALRQVTVSSKQNPVEVVLDALPAEANSSALAASMQKRLLVGDGVVLEMLAVEPVSGVETGDAEAGTGSGLNEAFNKDAYQIEFRFEVAAKNPAALKKVLQRLERSIRTVTIRHIELESQGSRVQLIGEGSAYYYPKVETIMKEVTVPSNEEK